MSPFDAFQMFTALKLHFTSDSYNYVKYRGKVKVNPTTFETRNDRYFFQKLSNQRDAEFFCVANLFAVPNIWIGDLFKQDAIDRYRERKKVVESLTYMFKSDMSRYDSMGQAFRVEDTGSFPLLISDYMQNNIQPETAIIVMKTLKLDEYWTKNLDDIVWPEVYRKLDKYSYFLEFERPKYNAILLDMFD